MTESNRPSLGHRDLWVTQGDQAYWVASFGEAALWGVNVGTKRLHLLVQGNGAITAHTSKAAAVQALADSNITVL